VAFTSPLGAKDCKTLGDLVGPPKGVEPGKVQLGVLDDALFEKLK
jgi:hypothetical protein